MKNFWVVLLVAWLVLTKLEVNAMKRKAAEDHADLNRLYTITAIRDQEIWVYLKYGKKPAAWGDSK